MTVIQSLGWYFPDSSGGTEVYVDGLVAGLKAFGTRCTITAPRPDEHDADYDWNGAQVHRVGIGRGCDLEQIRGHAAPPNFERFQSWLRSSRATVYHQHSWTYGCNLHHLRAAKEMGLRTILTVHVPAFVCLRGTMMLMGQSPCDGRLDLTQCGTCWADARKIPIAKWISRLPLAVSGWIERSRFNCRIATAASTCAMVSNHVKNFHEAVRIADKVVAVCEWLRQALLSNGVPSEKLILNRQGVTEFSEAANRSPRADDRLRIGFLGRCDEVKGIHVLVEAVRRLPSGFPVELTIHASGSGTDVDRYRVKLRELARNDKRIRFANAIPRNQILESISGYDLVAVPSIWLETGPLVVLEAFAAGVPVIGSDLGGISELVHHGENGWLVKHGDVASWSEAIRMLATDRKLLHYMAKHRPPVRTMQDVSRDMNELYHRLSR